MIYLRLFYEFFFAGLFSIGGGLATLPFLYNISDKTGWFTHAELVNMIAVSESTPGPIGVNMATYVGFNTAGIVGAICATLGLIAPSIIVIIIIAGFLKKFRDNFYVNAAFYGLRPASTALIGAAGFSVALITFVKQSLIGTGAATSQIVNLKAVLLAVPLLIMTNINPTKKLHPVFFIAFSAAVGIIFKFT
ncbi:MAG: chromate transporter [Oscillospiraceae bacterium]